MDSDNPWGANSVDSSPNLKTASTPTEETGEAPRLSLDVEEEDASWGNDPSESSEVKRDVEETKEVQLETEASVTTTDVQKGDIVRTPDVESPGSKEEEHEPSSPTAPTSEPTSTSSLPPPVPIVLNVPTESEEPPMDDFPDDDAFSATSASPSSPSKPSQTFTVPPIASAQPSEDPPMDDFDDFDDDDFGEMGDAAGGAGGDDDFGDFGDFGDSAPLDESAFDAPPPAIAQAQPTPQPIPSTSSFPPLRLDLSNGATRRTIAPQLRDFVSTAWGDVSATVSDEPERQVEGVAQVLVTEES
jgi:hypothetical protein